MVLNLKQAFKSMIDDATWMDMADKATAKEKVDAINDFIGYPDWINDKIAVEDYYKGVPIQNYFRHRLKEYFKNNIFNQIVSIR